MKPSDPALILDLRCILETCKRATNLASVRQRFFAWAIDAAVAIVITLPVDPVIYDVDIGSTSYWLLFGSTISIALLYLAVGDAIGGTVGKRLLGLRVVGTDGEPIGIRRGFIRRLVYLAGGLTFYVGWLWALQDPQRQTWHDKVARSVVTARGRANDLRARVP